MTSAIFDSTQAGPTGERAKLYAVRQIKTIAYTLCITVDENFKVHLAQCDREKKKVHRECLYDRLGIDLMNLSGA